MADYTNQSQVALLKVLEHLANSPLTPQTIEQVVEVVGCSRDQAFRALWNLEACGWAEKSGAGYLPAPKFTLASTRFVRAIQEINNKYLGISTSPFRSPT